MVRISDDFSLIAGENLKAGDWVYIEPRNGKAYRLRQPTRWSRLRNFWRRVVLGKNYYNWPMGVVTQDIKRDEQL